MSPAMHREMVSALFFGCDPGSSAAEMAIAALKGFALDVEAMSAAASDDVGCVEEMLPRLEARMTATIRALEEQFQTEISSKPVANSNGKPAEPTPLS